tara:strand:+ start:1376 stop:3340 length:1965 start_codon:yes stop_codon:yes gene_type:complete
MKNVKFYKEINSLRALSIIAVLIYHSEINIFGISLKGGYLGVDIFFVISGYLISNLLYQEYKIEKKINFSNFYIKRVRRILPLILFFVLFTSIVGYYFLLPNQIFDLIKSSISQFLFLSNYYFFISGDNYFSISDIYRPLLHLWSLSIEEQFYLLFPIFLVLIYKFKATSFKNLILIFFVLCFIASLTTYFFKSFSFYSISSRCFEFFAGFICTYLKNNYKKNISNFNIHYLDVFGFLILIICFFIFDKKTFHPSFLTLIPIFGCSLIILFSDYKKAFYKFFTFYPIQIIGLTSFSLYVWHYPIFIFAKNTGLITGRIDLKVYLILLLCFLSILSYFIIEKPFRNKKLISNKFFLIFCLVMFSLNFLFFNKISNISKINSHHMLNKINLETGLNNRKISNSNYTTKECTNKKDSFCKIFKDKSNKNIIFLGDSMVQQLIPNFDNRNLNINIYDLSYSGMIYLKNYERVIANKITAGQKHHDNRINLINSLENKTIIFFGRYSYIANNNYDYRKKNNVSNFSESFRNSIQEILDSNVEKLVLIYPTPEYDFNVLTRMKQMFVFDKKGDFIKKNQIYKRKEIYTNKNKEIVSLLDSINDQRIIRVYPDKYFCDLKNCYTHNQNNLYYSDSVHLSEFQINNIGNEIINKLSFFKIIQ